jgi:hypothetical protein
LAKGAVGKEHFAQEIAPWGAGFGAPLYNLLRFYSLKGVRAVDKGVIFNVEWQIFVIFSSSKGKSVNIICFIWIFIANEELVINIIIE